LASVGGASEHPGREQRSFRIPAAPGLLRLQEEVYFEGYPPGGIAKSVYYQLLIDIHLLQIRQSKGFTAKFVKINGLPPNSSKEKGLAVF
jgi:hypothetical protein